MKQNTDNGSLLNKSIRNFFKDVIKIIFKDPSLAMFFLRTLWNQEKAARVRSYWETQGIQVPPFMMTSVTHRCNLHCKGCYAQFQHRSPESELSSDKLKDVIGEAHELGISIITFLGGEPLLRPEILNIAQDYPEIMFPAVTNGLLIDERIIGEFVKLKNVIPILSIEGYADDTDQRRGKGVFERLQKVMNAMSGKSIFWGVSLTMTGLNFSSVTDSKFIQELINLGSKLFFFTEYVPVEKGTDNLVLTDEQRSQFPSIKNTLRSKFPGLFVSFQGKEDEIAFGGCLAAGRGFIHLSPEGNLEPCPFAPFSDTNVIDRSLKEALQSKFLQAIRQNHQSLSESTGGCALLKNHDWIQSLLHQSVRT